jgi:hypothetical protein
MILENGVVRTMDPALPAARALALAGPYVAGGVGVHETALASPDVVNLGGRCVLPAFTDSHVHFPTWSLAQRQVGLDGCASFDEALARVREAEIPRGRWLRGYGWRDGDWNPYVAPTKEALDEVTGETPTIMISKDYHSAWLNSAALAAADGDLDLAGGVVERDEQGEPTGTSARPRGGFATANPATEEKQWRRPPDRSTRAPASRLRGRLAQLADHRRLRDGEPQLRSGLDPHDQPGQLLAVAAPASGTSSLPDRLPEVLWTDARARTAAAGGSGVGSHSASSGDHRRGADAAGRPVASGDRRQDARRLRGDRGAWELRPAPADRARSA